MIDNVLFINLSERSRLCPPSGFCHCIALISLMYLHSSGVSSIDSQVHSLSRCFIRMSISLIVYSYSLSGIDDWVSGSDPCSQNSRLS